MLTLLPDTDPTLRQVAEPVTVFDDELTQLVFKMKQFMIANNGIGLAAPQLGISKRIIVVANGIYGGVLINPEITASEGQYKFKEGCLTFPKLFLNTTRAQKVSVRYQALNEFYFDDTVENLHAVVIQHEIDHLNGKLLIDQVSPIALALARKKLKQTR
jgi:peptide deformylase